MQIVKVAAEREYEVVIGCEWKSEFVKVIADRSRVLVILPSSLASRVKDDLPENANLTLFEMPNGEGAKTAGILGELWAILGAGGFTRSDLIVAIGGGTVTDVAGFAAATWLRGIDWVAIPTTLAGMVDAAIGGKTGINSVHGKNLIGAFHSPRKVIIDQWWLDSISDRDFSAGLSEVIKCGFIADRRILEIVEMHGLADLRQSLELTQDLIFRAVTVKARTVGEDFRDNFAREILNYGHTMGHAIELQSKYQLRHGEAVAIGMVFIAELANLKGILAKEVVERHRKILVHVNLPIAYQAKALPELIPLLFLDKKSRGNTLRFVAISEIGTPLRIESVVESEIAAAYERVSS